MCMLMWAVVRCHSAPWRCQVGYGGGLLKGTVHGTACPPSFRYDRSMRDWSSCRPHTPHSYLYQLQG